MHGASDSDAQQGKDVALYVVFNASSSLYKKKEKVKGSMDQEILPKKKEKEEVSLWPLHKRKKKKNQSPRLPASLFC